MEWLSNVSYKEHHDFYKSLRSPGTGGWLLVKPNFRSWDDSGLSSLLWLHGIGEVALSIPLGIGSDEISGVWKNNTCVSILISTPPLLEHHVHDVYPALDSQLGTDFNRCKIIDEMEPKTKGCSLAYFYCNYKEEQRRDPASILRSLVKQLCLLSPGEGSLATFPEPVLAVYSERKDKGDLSRLLSLKESKDLLIKLSAGFLKTMIIIDALDECDRSTRRSLFDLLEQVVSSAKQNPVKIFVTSRDDGDLMIKFEDSPNVYIQERDNSGDIDHYIQTEIEACITAKRLLRGNVSLDLQNRIVAALQAGARGM